VFCFYTPSMIQTSSLYISITGHFWSSQTSMLCPSCSCLCQCLALTGRYQNSLTSKAWTGQFSPFPPPHNFTQPASLLKMLRAIDRIGSGLGHDVGLLSSQVHIAVTGDFESSQLENLRPVSAKWLICRAVKEKAYQLKLLISMELLIFSQSWADL